MEIIKRNGLKENFNLWKIVDAIEQANEQVALEFRVDSDASYKIAKSIMDEYEITQCTPTVEEVQDLVELKLMDYSPIVAKEYITYRYKRQLARDKYVELMDAVSQKIQGTQIENQNANVDENSFGGRIGEATDVMLRQYALDFCMSKKTRENHLKNRVYVHDLNHYAVGSHNCLTIPFDKLLANGFVTRQTDVRPANSINTAMQLVAVIFQLQSLQQFGGVSASHLDWTMVPYVRKSFAKHYKNGLKYLANIEENQIDYSIAAMLSAAKDYPIDDSEYEAYSPAAYKYAMEMTENEAHQAVEGMYHNLNTLQSRSGCQLPFTSVNYGTCTLLEGRMVIKALLEVSLEGLGKLHRTSIFPCGIFQCMKGVNRKPGDPNYDLFQLALKSTAERLYPNYANVDWSGNTGYDIDDPKSYFSTMGCRTSNGYDINGLNQTKDGRGNICPTTIILPTLAMEAATLSEQSEEYVSKADVFLKVLDEALTDAKDSLLERFEWIASQSPAAAKFMYENGTMEGYVPEEGIRSALKHGTLAIGMLGMAEALQILVGCNHTTERGMELAKQICALYKKRCAEFKEKYRLNFGVYFTPSENLCHTALKKFRAQYGEVVGVSDNDFFTNSMHIPVWEEITPFKKIDLESQLTGYNSAGCITYVEIDTDAKNNLEALETLVNYAMDKDIPYFAINVPCDMCEDCGHKGDIDIDVCPVCGGTHISRLRRVTGYLTGDYTTAFNKGKQQEVQMRYQHSKKDELFKN